MTVQNGELTGFEGATASDVFKASGIDFVLEEAPGARQLDLVGRDVALSCAVGIYWTADRARLGKFTLPIYHKQSQVVVVRTDNPKAHSFTLLSAMLADSAVSLAMRNGYSYGYKIDAMLEQAKARLKRPSDDSHGRIRMVLEGMADGAIFTAQEADYQLQQFGEAGKLLTALHFSDIPPGEPSHLYCSRSVDDAVISRLNDAIKKRTLK